MPPRSELPRSRGIEMSIGEALFIGYLIGLVVGGVLVWAGMSLPAGFEEERA